MRGVVGVLIMVAACGRIGIERHGGGDDAPGDGPGTSDAAIDAVPACPADMTELTAGSSLCIERADRGAMIWLDGKTVCEGLGRRYCADAEWLLACNNAVGLVEMTGDNYEWVAEESNGVAQKRGESDCDDSSSHDIVDPYEVRCCGPKI